MCASCLRTLSILSCVFLDFMNFKVKFFMCVNVSVYFFAYSNTHTVGCYDAIG